VGGQVGDLVEIAGALPDELGMGQVEQGSTLDDQVLAVVEQGSQRRGPTVRRTGGSCGSCPVIRALAHASTGSVLPLPSWLRR
jgi:hypothetical protein